MIKPNKITFFSTIAFTLPVSVVIFMLSVSLSPVQFTDMNSNPENQEENKLSANSTKKHFDFPVQGDVQLILLTMKGVHSNDLIDNLQKQGVGFETVEEISSEINTLNECIGEMKRQLSKFNSLSQKSENKEFYTVNTIIINLHQSCNSILLERENQAPFFDFIRGLPKPRILFQSRRNLSQWALSLLLKENNQNENIIQPEKLYKTMKDLAKEDRMNKLILFETELPSLILFYEDLLLNSSDYIQKLCHYLQVSFDSNAQINVVKESMDSITNRLEIFNYFKTLSSDNGVCFEKELNSMNNRLEEDSNCHSLVYGDMLKRSYQVTWPILSRFIHMQEFQFDSYLYSGFVLFLFILIISTYFSFQKQKSNKHKISSFQHPTQR